MILGTISAVDNDNGLQLIIDGEDDPTTKKYTYMASYVPTANDRVLIEEVGGSYVIMGKVISDMASSGIARQADNATNAVNAQNAQTAQSAETATTAEILDGTNTQYGQLVTYVTTQYSSVLGGNYVSSITTGSSKNFLYNIT